jgi:hypothetical protein
MWTHAYFTVDNIQQPSPKSPIGLELTESSQFRSLLQWPTRRFQLSQHRVWSMFSIDGEWLRLTVVKFPSRMGQTSPILKAITPDQIDLNMFQIQALPCLDLLRHANSRTIIDQINPDSLATLAEPFNGEMRAGLLPNCRGLELICRVPRRDEDQTATIKSCWRCLRARYSAKCQLNGGLLGSSSIAPDGMIHCLSVLFSFVVEMILG